MSKKKPDKAEPYSEGYHCAECGIRVHTPSKGADIPRRSDGEKLCWPCKSKHAAGKTALGKTIESLKEEQASEAKEKAPVVKVDATVLTKVIKTIETEARLYMKLVLAEGKGHFAEAVKELPSAIDYAAGTVEQNRVIEFFRGRLNENDIWNDCPIFKAALLEKITERWGQKTP